MRLSALIETGPYEAISRQVYQYRKTCENRLFHHHAKTYFAGN